MSLDARTLDRRTFFTGLAALGAAALTRPAGAAAKPHRIDIHHHLRPPAYVAELVAQGEGAGPGWTPAKSIDEMDQSGIATSLLSINPPGVWFGNAEQGRRLSRIINDYGAKMVKDFPSRFGLFAALPLLDTDGSLREIEYAMDSLKANGIGLMTSYADKWLGDASFAPIWEELNRRKAVVYTHPTVAACCRNLKFEVPPASIEYATDTTRTIASLVFSGTAARFPDIRWIHSHGGGTMPFLISRFLVDEKGAKEREKRLPNGVMYELKKFYYDTAQANHPGALAAILKLVTPAQMLYGTDYPFRPGAEETDGLAAQHFAPNDLMAIERDNALRLLPELK
jgi:6-methylsalicylate decarboxylase